MKNNGNGVYYIMTVVKHERNKIVAVSTHQKDLSNLMGKIKNPGDILYEKEYPGSHSDGKPTGGAGGNGDKPLANNGDNHLHTLSPTSGEKSSNF